MDCEQLAEERVGSLVLLEQGGKRGVDTIRKWRHMISSQDSTLLVANWVFQPECLGDGASEIDVLWCGKRGDEFCIPARVCILVMTKVST